MTMLPPSTLLRTCFAPLRESRRLGCDFRRPVVVNGIKATLGLLSDKFPDRSVNDVRIRRKVMVSFARQYD